MLDPLGPDTSSFFICCLPPGAQRPFPPQKCRIFQLTMPRSTRTRDTVFGSGTTRQCQVLDPLGPDMSSLFTCCLPEGAQHRFTTPKCRIFQLTMPHQEPVIQCLVWTRRGNAKCCTRARARHEQPLYVLLASGHAHWFSREVTDVSANHASPSARDNVLSLGTSR